MGQGLPRAGEHMEPSSGSPVPVPRIPETCNCVSGASVGSLPPRLVLVCNVFMYVFVNVTEVFGEGRGAAAAATLRSALSLKPLPPSALRPSTPGQQAARGRVWKGCFKAVG